MEIPFVKLHGNGNDFILIDEFAGAIIPDEMKAHFAALYCDRRFGIGGDGVLFLQKEGNDIRMRLFQPDESEAEMCGNGIRCLAKYVFDAGYVKSPCTIQTLAGPVTVKMEYDEDGDFMAEVEMTKPAYDAPAIPAKGKGDFHEIINGYEVYAVNTGVPHAVVFFRDLDVVDITKVAPGIRSSQFFPAGANVNLVQVTGPDSIKIQTWERGVEGETLSCGTGATASAAIAHRLSKTGPVVEVETIGGPLTITLTDGAFMKGPAETVFKGVLTLEE
ncbi:diaminopimelate epimerase [Methanospirillum sp. J.3.6.1-F.2.7.3]|uniref:Diaminopimelate epimerase n=1 Tax=Methanospirillum purgamenti TaxID=2834276 RepID=A0A8E7B0X8_9EURY|nr:MULTISPECIES: diaminopimelate epimerase [Methanospirillum]MDX8549166.1 diaminopimelate epimerase [Methanospirillum hungatei]QVV88839.1 diaminopimelate epimerase [Methanospirillum sp. J.3.6.1-F.2.7.3]